MRFAMLAPDHDAESLAAIRSELDLFDIELVSMPSMQGDPMRASVEEVFDELIDDMLDELTVRGPWDGVLLALTGMDCVPCDATGLAERVRRILGPNIPVGTVNKVDANVDRQLLAGLTMLWAVRTMAVDPTVRPRYRLRQK